MALVEVRSWAAEVWQLVQLSFGILSGSEISVSGITTNCQGFILLTILVGAGVVVWALLHLQPVPWLGPIVLGTCALIAELYPVRLSEEGTVSVAAALDFAAVILFPPQVSILIVAFAAGFSDIIGRVPPIRVLFNTAQLAIAATLASKVYSLGPGGVFTFQTHALWGLISGLTFCSPTAYLPARSSPLPRDTGQSRYGCRAIERCCSTILLCIP